MTAQLQWRRRDDWTIVGSLDERDLYTIKRLLNHDDHPAVNYSYTPTCLADPYRVVGDGDYTDSKLARQACEDDLQQLQQAAATTKG